MKQKKTSLLIKEYLQERGIKQRWLANKTGLSDGHISNVLEDRVLLTKDTLNKINKALELDFNINVQLLLKMKRQQKKNIIDIMNSDEETGLYDS